MEVTSLNVSPDVLEAVRIMKLRGGYRSMSEALRALLEEQRGEELRLAQEILEKSDATEKAG